MVFVGISIAVGYSEIITLFSNSSERKRTRMGDGRHRRHYGIVFCPHFLFNRLFVELWCKYSYDLACIAGMVVVSGLLMALIKG